MKKILMIVGVAGSVIFFGLVFSGYDGMARVFQMFPALLILSLMFSLLKETVFKIWAWFAVIYLPVSIIMVALVPQYGSPFLRIEKDTVAFGSSILFVAVSLLIAGSIYISRGGRRGE